jgi:hypothetical protein
MAGILASGWLLAGCQPAPSGTPSSAPVAVHPIYEAGDVVTIDAVDSGGRWGSITLTRGDDTGGYPTEAVPADSFVIEVFVSYHADRLPNAEGFGMLDWRLATADDGNPVGRLIQPAMPPDPADWNPARQPLGNVSSAVDMLTTPIEGMLYFEVPREVVDGALVLVYVPSRISNHVVWVPVRKAGPAPDPVPAATPVPTPIPLSYVERAGLPFTIVDSPEADALFGTPDTCTNPVAGYTVTYPDAWWTNTAIDGVPACSWFSPTFFEASDTSEVPKEVVIVITVFEGAFGFFTSPQDSLYEEITIDGYQGSRREQVGMCYPAGGCEMLPPSYHYSATFGGQGAEGPSMQAVTSSDGIHHYELNKAVLDRIMASFDYEAG